MPCKAVLFDMDGTLLDTLQDIALTLNTVLERNGWPTHNLDDYRFLVGRGMRELVRSALPEGEADTALVDQLLGELTELYEKNWNIHSRPYPGIATLLEGIKQMGLRMAILSNKADRFTKLCAEHLLSSWDFAVVMGHHDGIQHKPDPSGALSIAQMMQLEPEEFLYVGDSGIDMKTASAAGMPSVGVLWGFRPESELVETGANTLVEKPEQILDLLEACRTSSPQQG